MKFKGTKGNWDFGQKQTDQIQDVYSVYCNGGLIHKGLSPRVYDHLSKESSKANAQLISCAPEMLEILIKTNELLLEDSLSIEQIKLREEIEKLIKKATTI